MKIKDPAGNLLPKIEIEVHGTGAQWLLETIQVQLQDAKADKPGAGASTW